MRFPKLKQPTLQTQTQHAFGGYCHRTRVGAGEWYDMQNLTGAHYPTLATRAARGLYATPAAVGGLCRFDTLLYTDGADLVVRDYRVPLGLVADGRPKKLIRMGAYVIVMPDKRYVNLANLADFGGIEAHVTRERVHVRPCRADGVAYTRVTTSPAAPGAPADGECVAWIDSSSVPILCEYSAAMAGWMPVDRPHLRLEAGGIGAPFSLWDGVHLTGLPAGLDGVYTLQHCESDAIVIAGALCEEQSIKTLDVSREMPEMDFVIESGNRLWGCRYGVAANGSVVNEIYASALGDFRNWSRFDGAASDSFAVGVGTDGAFTGAVTFGGMPIFFKEHCMHRVGGSYPATYQVYTSACEGVRAGSDESVVDLGDVLLYHADGGVYLYDGSLPVCVSDALGDVRYDQAAAGALAGRYYVSMRDRAEGTWHLFVYDTAQRLWHREDDCRARAFCRVGEMLYFIDGAGRIQSVEAGAHPVAETRIPFYAVSGVIGGEAPAHRYLERLHLRMGLAAGARVTVSVQYDSIGNFEEIYTTKAKGTRGVTAILRPRRCDHLRLRIEGEGDVRLFALTTYLGGGSDHDA